MAHRSASSQRPPEKDKGDEITQIYFGFVFQFFCCSVSFSIDLDLPFSLLISELNQFNKYLKFIQISQISSLFDYFDYF